MRRSEGQLTETLQRLQHVQETERRSLAMDLHDDALPAMAAVSIQLELAQGLSGDDHIRDRLRQAERELRDTTLRLRHLTFDLLPEVLAGEGLTAALRQTLEAARDSSGLDYQLRDRFAREIPPQASAVLYRIALEALRNVTRHARATLVRIELSPRGGAVQVTISDDGAGFAEMPGRSERLGIRMMRERAELAGGEFEILSRPGHGTTVTFAVPVETAGHLDLPTV